ncbi:MAG: TlpA family protein disulfide reductase [Panacagrimonas sp.]
MKQVLMVAVLALIAGFAGFIAYRYFSPVTQTVQVPPSSSTRAPDLNLPTLDGGVVRLADLRGKLVLINFWATWCAPCLKEIPVLVDMQERYGARGFQMLGPAMDDPEQIRLMLPRLKIQYPILIGDTAIASAMDTLGDTLGALPFSVLISADGYVLARKHGEYEAEELSRLIEAHLPP